MCAATGEFKAVARKLTQAGSVLADAMDNVVTEEVRRTLTRLEEAMWREDTRFDMEFMEAVLAPDFFELAVLGELLHASKRLQRPGISLTPGCHCRPLRSACSIAIRLTLRTTARSSTTGLSSMGAAARSGLERKAWMTVLLSGSCGR